MDKIKILLTGGSGRLGKFILNNIDKEKYELHAPESKKLDITNLDKELLNTINPDIILHAAAYTDVKKAQEEYVTAININVAGTINLLNFAIQNNKDFIYISTDAVFDGKKGNYKPNDPINPVNKYAKTKAAAELVCRTYPKSVIIRTAFFEFDFPYEMAFYDQYSSKDYLDIIGPKIINIIYNYRYGIYHVGSERKSIFEIASERKNNVQRKSRKEFNFITLEDTSFDQENFYGDLL